jgi:hypothetical protein
MISADKLTNMIREPIPEQELELRICIPVLYLSCEELISRIKQVVGSSWLFSNGVLSYFTFHNISEESLNDMMQYMEVHQVPYDIVRVFSYRPRMGNALTLLSKPQSRPALQASPITSLAISSR